MTASRHDLVVLSLEAWDSVWRRNQYLLHGLMLRDPGLRVLFVEPPADPLYELRQQRIPRPGRGLRALTESGIGAGRLWALHPTKWLPRAAGPAADRLLEWRVLRGARTLGFDRPLLWVNDPAGAGLLQRTGWPAFYDITDDWLEATAQPRIRQRVAENERRLLTASRAVVVCSENLARTKPTDLPLHVIPNAVDADRFRAPQPRPADLPPGRVAVYVGTLHADRIDVDLCADTARRLSDAGRLVLIGPDLLEEHDRGRLDEAGVVRLGARGYQEVPAYLQHADALVVPHVMTPFTESLDPIKRYEYQVMGRPIVATPVAGFRDLPGAEVASGAAFVTAVGSHLRGEPLPAGALPVSAPVPTWGDRVTAMAAVLAAVGGS